VCVCVCRGDVYIWCSRCRVPVAARPREGLCLGDSGFLHPLRPLPSTTAAHINIRNYNIPIIITIYYKLLCLVPLQLQLLYRQLWFKMLFFNFRAPADGSRQARAQNGDILLVYCYSFAKPVFHKYLLLVLFFFFTINIFHVLIYNFFLHFFVVPFIGESSINK